MEKKMSRCLYEKEILLNRIKENEKTHDLLLEDYQNLERKTKYTNSEFKRQSSLIESLNAELREKEKSETFANQLTEKIRRTSLKKLIQMKGCVKKTQKLLICRQNQQN